MVMITTQRLLNKILLIGFALFFVVNFGSLAQTLRISSDGQTGTSGTNWSTSGTNPKIITATGTAHISTIMIQDYLDDGFSVEIRNIASPGKIEIVDRILKRTGGDATLTIRANGRVDVWTGRNIESQGGKLNVVLWSDYDNTNSGGVTIRGNIISNGGHVWLGGSSSSGGSLIWNGLTVGNGPSEGAIGEHSNALDIWANVTTSGGDFLAWAGDKAPGTGGISGIANDGAGDNVNTGSGDIILIADALDGTGSLTLGFETTGQFTLAPNGGSFPSTFLWESEASGADFDFPRSGVFDYFDYLRIKNVASLSGLTIGQYTGTGLPGDDTFSINNTSNVTISTATTIAGPFSVYGGTIAVNANVNTTAGGAAGDVLFKASGNITQANSVDIDTDGGDVIYWADSDQNNDGVIGFANSGGQDIITNGGDVIMAGGAGTTVPTGYAHGSSGRGISLPMNNARGRINTSKSGGTAGDIIIRGKTSGSRDGIYTENFQFFGHNLTLDGETGSSSYFGVRLGSINVYNGSNLSGVIDVDNDLTITAVNTAASYAGNAIRTGSNPRFFADGNITFNTSGKLNFTSGQSFININPTKTLSVNYDGPVTSFTTPLGDPNSNTPQGDLVIQSYQQNSFTSAFNTSAWTISDNLSSLTIGKTTNTADVTVSSSQTIAGPISVYGGNVSINENLNTTAGAADGDILLKASGNVVLNASKSITTSGAPVILWSNSDNEASLGSIALRNGSAIVTGSESVPGGAIWLGGGSDGGTWSGLSVGDGYAVPGTSFTPSNGGSSLTAGVYLERNSLASFGGNIKIAGDAATSRYGIVTYGNTVAINSGTGTIEMDGQASSTASGNRTGILFGIHDKEIASTVNISSAVTVGDAITISGIGFGKAGDAIAVSGTITMTASGGGNIELDGDAVGRGRGRSIVAGNYYHGIINLYANSGDILLNGNTKSVAVATAANTSGKTSGPSKINIGQGGSIASSSSDVTITGDQISVGAGGVAVNSTGQLAVEPFGTSFSAALTWPVADFSVASGLTGLRLGKEGNTANITIGSATTVAGPIDIYGGNITLDGNINTTSGNANGDILFKSSGDIIQNESKAITTNGGNVIFWSNADGQIADGSVLLRDGSTISTAGGHVWMGGGSGSTTWNGLTVGDGFAVSGISIQAPVSNEFYAGIYLEKASINTSGGNVYLAGAGTSVGTTRHNSIVTFDVNDINAGSGTITLKGGSETTSGRGIAVSMHNSLRPGSLTLTSTSTEASAINIDSNSTSNIGTAVEGTFNVESTNTGGISFTSLGGGTDPALRLGFSTSSSGVLNVLANSGDILVNLGERGINIQNNQSNASLGGKANTAVLSSASDIQFISNDVTAAGALNFSSSGDLIVEPFGTSFSSTLNTTSLTYSGGISGLTLGKSGNTSDITVGSTTTIAGPITVYGSSLAINGPLTATDNNINLHASGTVSQTAAITANGLGLHGTGTFTLDNTSNNVVTIAGGDNTNKLGSLSYVDASGGLEIGSVNPDGIYSVGPILIETLEGDITLSQDLVTEDGTADAIIINAGKNSAIGTSSGGDIKVSGTPTPTLSMGDGGIVKLFSGSESGSTNLSDLVGGTANNIRRGVDEATTSFSPILEGDNVYALYRELPLSSSMILVFNTNLATGTTVTLPFRGTTNVNVDWGDGTNNDYTTFGNVTKTYGSEGTYTVTITGLASSGTSLYGFGSASTPFIEQPMLTKVESFGDLGLVSLKYAFLRATNLVEVPNTLPSTVTDLSYTFRQASNFNQDLSGWIVSNVTNMASMFQGASNFNGNITKWNVSKVTNMNSMFSSASKFNQDISEMECRVVLTDNDPNMFFLQATLFNQPDRRIWDA